MQLYRSLKTALAKPFQLQMATAFTRSFSGGSKSYRDYTIRPDHAGHQWVDPRPAKLLNISATRNSDGDMVGQYEGEEVIFPDMEPTLEWVLSTPVEVHLFEERPIMKLYEDEEY